MSAIPNRLPDKDAITFEVVNLVAQVTGRNLPNAETDLDQLELDSLAMLELLAALEEHFDVVLNENIIKELRTIHDISRIVKELIRAK
jgi:acyl carrier protein